MSIYNYVVRRIGLMVVTLFFVTLIAFAVTNILPGDVALLILGPDTTEQLLEALQTQLRLDRPLYVQYIDWIIRLLWGNMGESLRFGEPMAQLIAEQLPRPMILAVATTLVAVVLSVPLGVYVAVDQNETPDANASMFASIGVSVPIFPWGLVFILALAVWLNLFPTGGYVPPSDDLVESLTRLVLPAGAMGFALTAYIIRTTRSSAPKVLSEEYISLARAKGMNQRVIVLKHALKNTITPVVTAITFQFSCAFGGVVVLEKVFFRPGIGRLMLTVIQGRGIPLIQGCTLMVALIYMFSNFTVDLLYAYFDPHIRYGGDD